eukprot:s2064_g11.t1
MLESLRPDMRAPAVAERSEPAVSASAEERLNSSPSDLPTQRPAGGKGKSKGIAPPKAKAKPKATANLAPRSTNNGFQNFFWQVIKENQDRECGKEPCEMTSTCKTDFFWAKANMQQVGKVH